MNRDDLCGCVIAGEKIARKNCPAHWTEGLNDLQVALVLLRRANERFAAEDEEYKRQLAEREAK